MNRSGCNTITKKLCSMDHKKPEPHIIIFPFNFQGHVNSMLKLAELLCLEKIHITFLVSQSTQIRLSNYSNVESRFKNYPFFKFETFPDVYEENPLTDNALIMLFNSVKATAKPFLKELLARNKSQESIRPPVTCIIADGIMGFAIDVAKEMGVPIIYFRTISSCAFWVYFSIPQLMRAEELPFNGSDMDMPIANVKGMELFLRRRDLPSLCRAGGSSSPSFGMMLKETQETPRTDGLILNTFDALEGPIISQIRTHCPNIYTVGPLHAHLKTKLQTTKSSFPSSNSLWEEDISCINWLDKQPSKSVLYVSFGSITVMTRDQWYEFWHGIKNSGTRFLWVIRPESIIKQGDENGIDFPEVLEEGTKEKGRIISWAPQEQVLAHEAIGGFLTHNGWNSTLESIVEGVPMICWPYFADQQTNSRFVGEVWKLGIDIKDSCDRKIIENAIREVMDVKKDEFQERAGKMAKLARDCVSEGGSSSQNLKRLIEDIRSKTIGL